MIGEVREVNWDVIYKIVAVLFVTFALYHVVGFALYAIRYCRDASRLDRIASTMDIVRLEGEDNKSLRERIRRKHPDAVGMLE